MQLVPSGQSEEATEHPSLHEPDEQIGGSDAASHEPYHPDPHVSGHAFSQDCTAENPILENSIKIMIIKKIVYLNLDIINYF